VSDPALTFLKYLFLALLYLFFLRTIRAVWVELREPKVAAQAPEPEASGDAAAPAESRMSRRRRRKLDRRDLQQLVVVDSPSGEGLEFALGEELTVGRAPGCGVALPDDSFVSQLHARVFRNGGQVWLEDLGSTNGTWLNGEKVGAPALLHEGDRVTVGRTTMEVRKQ
jgi:hypothetical protein